mmetsp:Transcript_12781/g.22606  ORF Transcript_12781/g.22606 Transcript_12781/m.22606 type:complete len:657 (+) Transcript_12781:122-2092(+)
MIEVSFPVPLPLTAGCGEGSAKRMAKTADSRAGCIRLPLPQRPPSGFRPRMGRGATQIMDLSPRTASSEAIPGEDVPSPSSARSRVRIGEERLQAREQRRLDVQRQLCEQLGLGAQKAEDGPTEAEVSGAKTPRASGGPISGPPRPPKPKPHRSAHSMPEASQGAPAEALPSGRRWKSALAPLWPDRSIDSPPTEPARCGMSKTIPISEASDTPPAAKGNFPAELSALHRSSPSKPLEEVRPGSATAAASPASTHSVALSIVLCESQCQDSKLAEPEPDKQALETSQDSKRETDNDVECDKPSESTPQSARPQSDEAGHERVRLLEESAKRLRDQAERLRAENRRSRVFGPSAGDSVSLEPTTLEDAPQTVSKHLEEMWRKIAELDETNKAESEKLAQEQRQAEERRRAQDAFEKRLQEQVERNLQEHREKEAREAEEQAAREEEARQAQKARAQRRMEQLAQEADRSKQLEEQRQIGRSEEMQSKWQQLEEELDKQWAEQEAEERRRVDDYARSRRRQFEDWERRLAAERQRFASQAEFCAAARQHKARSAAYADEQFYGHPAEKAPGYMPLPPEQKPSGNSSPLTPGSFASLTADELALLKELQSVQNFSRETQKAKVKELLFRWHPDKNPESQEKAKQLFQFIQQQRRLVLGL